MLFRLHHLLASMTHFRAGRQPFGEGQLTHPNTTYATLKRCLAGLTGRPASDFHAAMVLRDPPPDGAGFTNAGLDLLSLDLNHCFDQAGLTINPPLVGSETRGCTNLRDLFLLIHPRVQ